MADQNNFIETLQDISDTLSNMDKELGHLLEATPYTLNVLITLKTHTKTLYHHLSNIPSFTFKTELMEVCDFIEFMESNAPNVKDIRTDVSAALDLIKKCIVYCKYLRDPLEQQSGLAMETDPLVTPLVPFLKENMGVKSGWYCVCM